MNLWEFLVKTCCDLINLKLVLQFFVVVVDVFLDSVSFEKKKIWTLRNVVCDQEYSNRSD
jgi:hypothetical protein